MDGLDLIARLDGLTSPEAVGLALSRACAPYGLATLAIGGMPDPRDPGPPRFYWHNWPEDWGRLYYERGFGAIDPTVAAAMARIDPFDLEELRAGACGFALTAEQHAMLDAAAVLGRSAALIVPVHGPKGYLGMACLVGEGPVPPQPLRWMLHLWALYAHARMRSLAQTARPEPAAYALSAREVEALLHLKSGLPDAGIAERMGISVRTVRFHLSNARQHLRARTRAEALATALQARLLDG